MKNTIKWFGIIVLAAVIGFSFTACSDSFDGDTSINGTWVDSYGDKLVLDSGNWTMYSDDEPDSKGTYTAKDGKVTMTVTHVYIDAFGAALTGLNEGWNSLSDLKKSPLWEIFGDEMGAETQSGTYVLAGDTLTIVIGGGTSIYTRQ